MGEHDAVDSVERCLEAVARCEVADDELDARGERAACPRCVAHERADGEALREQLVDDEPPDGAGGTDGQDGGDLAHRARSTITLRASRAFIAA